jgi:hypothetical protein
MITPAMKPAALVVGGRERVYTAMLADPQVRWTVAGLAEQVPDEPLHSLRTALLLLVGERLAEIAGGGNVLGVQLTEDGSAVLDALLTELRRHPSSEPAEGPQDQIDWATTGTRLSGEGT